MREIALADARDLLEEIVREVAERRTAVWLTRDGERIAAVVDAESAARLPRRDDAAGRWPLDDRDKGDLGL